MDELEEILLELAPPMIAGFIGPDGIRQDHDVNEGKRNQAKAALLSWRDNHTAKMVRKAFERVSATAQHDILSIEDAMDIELNRLTINNKEKEQ